MRLLLILMFIASTYLFTQKAFADSTCIPIYGGGENCTTTAITLVKNVINPATNSDVHNMGQSDTLFHPGDSVTFHITITNTGSAPISGATVVDIFPQFLNFVSGPGNFTNTTNQLSFQTGTLAPNVSQTFTIVGTVMGTSQITTSQVVCVSNQATVTTPDNVSAQDSSQFCIQPTGLSVVSPTTPPIASPQPVSTPATGPSPLWMLVFPAGISGIALNRYVKKRKLV